MNIMITEGGEVILLDREKLKGHPCERGSLNLVIPTAPTRLECRNLD